MELITAWLIVFVIRLCLILLGWNLGVVEVCPASNPSAFTMPFFSISCLPGSPPA